MRHLFLFFLFATSGMSVSGCAYISGRQQIVSVDSVPRGLLVYQNPDRTGIPQKTPFFVKTKRQKELSLWYQEGEDGATLQETTRCSYNWISNIAGNTILPFLIMPFGLTAFSVSGLALSIDFLSEAAYECPPHLTLRGGSEEPVKDEEKCPGIFVLGPYQSGRHTMQTLITSWKKNNKLKKFSCSRFYSLSESSQILEYLNLNKNDRLRVRDLTDRNLRYIGYRSKQNYILQLTSPDFFSEDQVTLESDIFDLHKNKPVFGAAKTQTVPAPSLGISSTRSFFTKISFQLLPNSIRFGGDSSELTFSPLNDFHLENEELRFNLPRLFSFFDLATVGLPNGFDPWDWDLSTDSSLSTFYWSYDFLLRKDQDQAFDYRYDLFIVTMIWSLKLTGHSPVGAFSISGGVGALTSHFRENLSSGQSSLSPTYRVGFEYIAFLSRNLYFYLENYRLRANIPDSSLIRPKGPISHIGFGLGYYFGKSSIVW